MLLQVSRKIEYQHQIDIRIENSMRSSLAEKYVQELEPTGTLKPWEREIISGYLCRLVSYLSVPGYEYIQSHTIYIDTLFGIEDCLYYHGRDMAKNITGVIYFTSLENAINCLKTLHAPAEVLADYLEKTAVILQTVADKTRMVPEDARQIYQRAWKEQAQKYAQEAFQIRYKTTQDIPHETRMLQLYKKFAEQDGFAQKYLQYRYCEYRAQCEMAKGAASESETDGKPSSHHRQGFRFGETDKSDPLESVPFLTPTSS